MENVEYIAGVLIERVTIGELGLDELLGDLDGEIDEIMFISSGSRASDIEKDVAQLRAYNTIKRQL